MKQSRLDWLKAHAGFAGADCLLWPFSKIWNGYGNLSLAPGKIGYAHRTMCEIVNGPAPSRGHVAAHSCGNGQNGCVHPQHLSWKTPRENQLDRRKHGTSKRRGVWSPIKRKLTPEQEAQVCSLKGFKNQREIAAMFGISYQQVSLIQRGLDRQPKRQSIR